MFYQVVEEYVMQNRQRKLVKELELKQKLRNSLESNSDDSSYFLGEADGRLARFSRRTPARH